MKRERIIITIDPDVRAKIDEIRLRLGENRSEFIVKAARWRTESFPGNLRDRLEIISHTGKSLTLVMQDGARITGLVTEVGDDFLEFRESGGKRLLITVTSIASVEDFREPSDG